MQGYVSNELTHFLGRSTRSDEERYSLLLRVFRSGTLLDPRYQNNRDTPIFFFQVPRDEGEERRQNYYPDPYFEVRENGPVAANEFVAPEMVSTLFGAADVSLHCYKNVLTSGTIPLAQSMATAVIAPRMGCIEEMVPPSSGILYQPRDTSGLQAAMVRATEVDLQSLGNEGKSFIAKHTVLDLAQQVIQIYQSLPMPSPKRRGKKFEYIDQKRSEVVRP